MKKNLLKSFAALSLGFGLVSVPVQSISNLVPEVYAHSHGEEDPDKKRHASGEFEDDEVKDRDLSDWEGEWQSAYPYILSGDLDEVMEAKAEKNGDKTAEEYKEYYETGYKTDVERIDIKDDEVTFYTGDDKATGKYEYDGYEILTYESGKRGVRYLFTKVDGDEEAPKHFQFSDHCIEPTEDLGHFHLYFGDQPHEELLEELDNWPTYYPLDWSADDIVHDQLHH